MANKNQILYSVWSETEKKSYGEFLNKECALKFVGITILRLSSKEYSKFLIDNRGTLTEADYYHYARLHIQEFYNGNIVLKRKIYSDKFQGFVDFDSEYSFDIEEYIDMADLVNTLVKKAIEIVGKPNGMRR